MACAREFHHSKALFDHLNYVRTGCLCTWACFSLPCAMPVAVRHAGRGADSLLASNSGFVVPPMRISAPMLPAGDLQTLADKVCYYREHLHLQPEERRTCILAWTSAVDSLLCREHSQLHTARASASVAQAPLGHGLDPVCSRAYYD